MDIYQNITDKSIQYRTNMEIRYSLNYLTGDVVDPKVFVVGKGSPDVTPDIQINEGGKLISREHLQISMIDTEMIIVGKLKIFNLNNPLYGIQAKWKNWFNKQFDWVPLKNSTGIYIGPPEQGKEKGVVIEIYNEAWRLVMKLKRLG